VRDWNTAAAFTAGRPDSVDEHSHALRPHVYGFLDQQMLAGGNCLQPAVHVGTALGGNAHHFDLGIGQQVCEGVIAFDAVLLGNGVAPRRVVVAHRDQPRALYVGDCPGMMLPHAKSQNAETDLSFCHGCLHLFGFSSGSRTATLLGPRFACAGRMQHRAHSRNRDPQCARGVDGTPEARHPYWGPLGQAGRS